MMFALIFVPLYGLVALIMLRNDKVGSRFDSIQFIIYSVTCMYDINI